MSADGEVAKGFECQEEWRRARKKWVDRGKCLQQERFGEDFEDEKVGEGSKEENVGEEFERECNQQGSEWEKKWVEWPCKRDHGPHRGRGYRRRKNVRSERGGVGILRCDRCSSHSITCHACCFLS